MDDTHYQPTKTFFALHTRHARFFTLPTTLISHEAYQTTQGHTISLHNLGGKFDTEPALVRTISLTTAPISYSHLVYSIDYTLGKLPFPFHHATILLIHRAGGDVRVSIKTVLHEPKQCLLDRTA